MIEGGEQSPLLAVVPKEEHWMSKKRKLESLQQLGVLTPKDVKLVQARINPSYRVEQTQTSWHTVRWASLSVVAALGWGSIAVAIGTAWKLSH